MNNSIILNEKTKTLISENITGITQAVKTAITYGDKNPEQIVEKLYVKIAIAQLLQISVKRKGEDFAKRLNDEISRDIQIFTVKQSLQHLIEYGEVVREKEKLKVQKTRITMYSS